MLAPSHVSATSHWLVAARQTVPAGDSESAGHASALPLQLSAGSQAPVDGRHSAVLFASAGHAALVPVHDSAMSQMPAEARHSTPAGVSTFAGHTPLAPSQVSAGSHPPADA